MAMSYPIKDRNNSRSKLLLVSSLLASSMAFAAEPNIIQAQSKENKAPIGSGEVSSDVAEKLFINMDKDFQKSQIEKLNEEMATLEKSHEQQKRVITSRLAELESGLSFQSVKVDTTTPITKQTSTTNTNQTVSTNTVTPLLNLKPLAKTITPIFIPKVSTLRVKRPSAAQFNNAIINPVTSYNTAQMNNATIKSLTNKTRLPTNSQQTKLEQAQSVRFQATQTNKTSTTDTSTSKISVSKTIANETVSNFLAEKKLDKQKKNNKKLTDSTKLSKDQPVQTKSIIKKKIAEQATPLIDEKGELLAIQPGSVTLNHEFHPVSIESTVEPNFQTKISKLKIKPHNKNTKYKNIVDKNPVENSVDPLSPSMQSIKSIKSSIEKKSDIKKPHTTVELSDSKQTIQSKPQQEPKPAPQSTSRDNPIASELYLKALQAFSVEQTDTAIRELQQYINAYQNESLIAKAHYWLGEAYLQKEPANYAAARFEFIEVIDRYNNHPSNDKQLKSLYRLSQLSKINNYDDDLKLYTQMLQDRYPTAEETQQALELLDK